MVSGPSVFLSGSGESSHRPARWPRWPYAAIALAGFVLWAMPVATSSSFLLDDAELAVAVGDWRLIYDTSQPPLYGWLWQAASSFLGVLVAAAQLVRITILTLLFCTIYRLGCLLSSHRWGPAVLLSGYIYLPILSWEATHAQTHTVLLSWMTLLSFLLVVEIRRRASLAKFILLGAVCGFGLMSKYTFVAILGSLFVAALMVREYRAALFRPATIAAIAAMLVVAAPPIIGVMLHLGEVSSVPTITQEVVDEAVPFVQRSWTGALRFVGEYALQSLLLAVMAVAAWWRTLRRAKPWPGLASADLRFFAVQATAGFAIMLGVIVVLGLDRVSAHHPAALLLSLPIVFVLMANAAIGPRMEVRWPVRLFVGGAGVAIITIGVALLLSLLYVFPIRFPSYEPLARAISASAGAQALVITSHYRMGGPLLIHEPGFTVFAADLGNRVAPPSRTAPSRVCVAAWRTTSGNPPPQEFVRSVEGLTGTSWTEPGSRALIADNATDGRAKWPQSWLEVLPAGGICAAPGESTGTGS